MYKSILINRKEISKEIVMKNKALANSGVMMKMLDLTTKKIGRVGDCFKNMKNEARMQHRRKLHKTTYRIIARIIDVEIF